MSNLKLNIRKEVLKTLNGIKIDTQEIKNQISFGCQSDFEITIDDFNFERLEASDVYLLVDTLTDEVNRLKMLLNLLK
jgi:transcriptional/translational regulatory protein YebC/TACO1